MGFFTKYLNKYVEKKLVDCPIEINKERCVALGQLCQEICVHSCPNQAITQGTREIDESLCHSCGNCVCSCPNGAIMIVNLQDDTLLRNIIHYGKNKKTVRFCCNSSGKHHKKNKKNQDDDFDIERVTSITVDCLSRLHPGLLLAPLAVDATYVWVDISGCAECAKNCSGKVLENININFTEAMEWLTQIEIDEARLMLASKLPDPVLVATKNEIEEASNYNRRAFFKNIGSGVKTNTVGVLGDVADQLLSDEEKKERFKLAPNQRKNGPPIQRQILLQVLKKLAGKKELNNDVYYQEKLVIDDTCSLCNICSRLCPTGAIELTKDKENELATIMYRPAYCLTCRKCESVCPKKLVSFQGKVDSKTYVNSKQLLVLETELAKCTKCKDVFPAALAVNNLCTICQKKN